MIEGMGYDRMTFFELVRKSLVADSLEMTLPSVLVRRILSALLKIEDNGMQEFSTAESDLRKPD